VRRPPDRCRPGHECVARPHRTWLCEISRGLRTSASHSATYCGPELMHRHGTLPSSNTDMATTFDPLVGCRCCFVLCASGSGVQSRFHAATGCHGLNTARKIRGLHCSTCGRWGSRVQKGSPLCTCCGHICTLPGTWNAAGFRVGNW
jgi:hypothetical protein